MLDGVGVADGLDTAGATVTSAGLATGTGVALAAGIEPGAASLIEETGRTNDTNMPHTNPNATLTMIRGAL